MTDLARVTELEPGGDYDGLTIAEVPAGARDATGARLLDCTFEATVLDGARFEHARLVDTAWHAVRADSLHASSATWQDGTWDGVRLGAVQSPGARWTRVRVVGGKIDYLNLRDATLDDVVLDGVVVDELDLARVRARRLVLHDCRVRRLDVTGATLADADLRGIRDLERLDGVAGLAGATISAEQLVELAGALAEHVGLRVV